MSTEFNRTLKGCCTCQFWDGKRELSGNKHVRADSGLTEGYCLNPKCSYKGKTRKINTMGCPHFTKWDKLP